MLYYLYSTFLFWKDLGEKYNDGSPKKVPVWASLCGVEIANKGAKAISAVIYKVPG
jgi:hypothetical protein